MIPYMHIIINCNFLTVTGCMNGHFPFFRLECTFLAVMYSVRLLILPSSFSCHYDYTHIHAYKSSWKSTWSQFPVWLWGCKGCLEHQWLKPPFHCQTPGLINSAFTLRPIQTLGEIQTRKQHAQCLKPGCPWAATGTDIKQSTDPKYSKTPSIKLGYNGICICWFGHHIGLDINRFLNVILCGAGWICLICYLQWW